MRRNSLSPIIASLVFFSSGCKLTPYRSNEIKSVDIAQTEVKDQGSVGFCWSYATIAYIEQLALTKKMTVADFSEEALAFYSMADYLAQLAVDVSRGQKQIPELKNGKFIDEGRFFKSREQNDDGALSLLKKYGVIPENEWSVKFGGHTGLDINKLHISLRDAFISYMQDRSLLEISGEDLINNVLVGPDRFPSRPPTKLQNGQTPVELLNSIEVFDPSQYESLLFGFEDDFEPMLKVVKEILAQQSSILFTFYADKNFLVEKNRFSDPQNQASQIKAETNHAVLLTDWVNQHDKPGKVADLEAAVKRPASELDYLVIKNSWGVISEYQGPDLSAGYMKIDQGFIKNALAARKYFSLIAPKGLAFKLDQKHLRT